MFKAGFLEKSTGSRDISRRIPIFSSFGACEGVLTVLDIEDGEVLSLVVIDSKAKVIDDFWIAIDVGKAHTVCVDLPPEMRTDRGSTTLELGVMSLVGCVATIFGLPAKKSTVTMSDLEINIQAEKPEGVKE